ncbi:hypothetical protein BDV18DRAFT_145343 [Aspergillus unguis]
MDGRNSEDRGDPNTSAEAHNIQCNLSNIPQSQQPATGRPSCSDNISESKSASDRSKQQYNPGQPCAEPASEEEASTTYRINTLRRDSDEPDSEDQGEESSSIKPDDLLNIVFNFDMPREVNLNVKIKGDFNVTVLA